MAYAGSFVARWYARAMTRPACLKWLRCAHFDVLRCTIGGGVRGALTGGSGDVIFTIRELRHKENIKEILAYLAGAGCVPEETRALRWSSAWWAGAARKRPDEMSHVFRKSGLPVNQWTMEGLKSLSGESEAYLRDDFTAARAIVAELLAVPADAMNVDDW